MKKLVIAIDCDDVLVDTLPQVVKDYNKIHNTKLGLEHMYRDVAEVADAFGVSTDQEAIQRLHAIYKQKDYYLNLPLVDGAIDAINELALHHELHLVTGRQSFLEPATVATLDRYFPGKFQSIEHTNFYVDDSEKDVTHRSKAEVCSAINADILIDDHIVHGEGVLAAGTKSVILFGDYPWNSTENLTPGMVRCADWKQVLKQVSKISG